MEDKIEELGFAILDRSEGLFISYKGFTLLIKREGDTYHIGDDTFIIDKHSEEDIIDFLKSWQLLLPINTEVQ